VKSVIVLLGFSGLLFAQEQPDPRVYRVGGATTPPRAIYRPDPEYTEEARKAKVNATVMTQVIVGADGKARDVKVIRPVGYGLDEKAIEAVATWRFKPGMKNGAPVNVMATIETNFRLLGNKGPWRIGPLLFRLQPGVSRPVLTNFVEAALPPNSGADKDTFEIELEVNENGTPQNFKVLLSPDLATEQAVLEAVREWRFTPAMQNGSPVAVTGTLQYLRGQ
jgi:TonB family protein